MRQPGNSGRIVYTARALRQDAEEAMRGNILRGLVELITNSDDAYTKLGAVSGDIRIEIERTRLRPWIVRVKDRASGMNQADMLQKIIVLGARTSGFESGAPVRGNRGRGAKDLVAFGPVRFESVKDSRVTELHLEQNGTYQVDERGCTDADRSSLGIPRGNGTVVTVQVSPRIRCPHHDNLRDQLSRHHHLRFITTDAGRKVVLVNSNNGEEARLRYDVDLAAIQVKFDEELLVDGYPSVRAHLKIWRLPERCDAPATDPGRSCGILLRGRRTVYENTLFSYEGHAHAGWFAGELDCPDIDSFAKAYDDRLEAGEPPEEENPCEIISRRREGLNPEHPLAAALRSACTGVLQGLVADEESRQRESARSLANEDTRRALSQLAREASRFMQDALGEIDADDPPIAEGDQPFKIVPPELLLTIGKERVASILASSWHLNGQREVLVAVDPPGIVETLTGDRAELRPHRRRQNVVTAQVRLRPVAAGEALLTATLGDRSDVALVVVKEVEAIEVTAEAPDNLEFERSRYRLTWNKRKSLHVRAPIALVSSQGTEAVVRSDQPGIVVLGARTHLSSVADGAWFEGVVQVEGRALGCHATIVARLGTCEARCSAVVEQSETPDLRIELADDEQGVYRAIFDPADPTPQEGLILKIMGRHPAILPLLGDDFGRQNEPECQEVIAEIVTDAVVRRLMEKKYPSGSELDAAGFYWEVYKYSARLLPKLRRITQRGTILQASS